MVFVGGKFRKSYEDASNAAFGANGVCNSAKVLRVINICTYVVLVVDVGFMLFACTHGR